jgi:hypothetical protein
MNNDVVTTNDGFFVRPTAQTPAYNQAQLSELLKNNVMTVTFTKVDGTERVMRCTLLPEYLPPETSGKQLLTENNRSNISVWDVEAQGWRSFRVDSVKNISVG